MSVIDLTRAQQLLRWGTVWPHRHGPKVGRAEAYLFTKWHLDPSNRLATTAGMPHSSA